MNNLDWKKIGLWLGVPLGLLVLFLFWLFFFPSSIPTPAGGGSFGTPGNQTKIIGGNQTGGGENQTINTSQNGSLKVFKIADGPIAGATLLQTQNPTTTVARYVSQNNGHVFDIVVDSPGAATRAVSNITIPGVQRVVWLGQGNVVMQYASGAIIKSVYFDFPKAATSSENTLKTTRVQFLSDNITSIGASFDGKNIAFLTPERSGVSGYIAKNDGSGAKKLFSLPLSQLLLSWPSTNTLLLVTKPAAGVPGMVFSVDSKVGGVVPIIYAQGVTATADGSFATVLYQTSDGTARSSYSHDVKKGIDVAVSFDPFPEKCVWSSVASSTLYCAAPLSYVSPDYLDFWHQGLAGAVDSIIYFDLRTGRSTIITTPGGKDGGVEGDVSEISLSPDERYLLFIKKGDRSLWGVRLTQ